jgi:hypothetical protein
MPDAERPRWTSWFFGPEPFYSRVDVLLGSNEPPALERLELRRENGGAPRRCHAGIRVAATNEKGIVKLTRRLQEATADNSAQAAVATCHCAAAAALIARNVERETR